ncbi:MAG: hypothetical protein D3904_10850 [Candidatus Electrothrix sp. EH2]|nr:hypothetical protein [Candidatus Electrothrix sp. EH2]
MVYFELILEVIAIRLLLLIFAKGYKKNRLPAENRFILIIQLDSLLLVYLLTTGDQLNGHALSGTVSISVNACTTAFGSEIAT